MPESLHQKVAEWRDADTRARAAERTLTHHLFGRTQDGPWAETLVTQAKLLRHLADEKLNAAIAAMKPQSSPPSCDRAAEAPSRSGKSVA